MKQKNKSDEIGPPLIPVSDEEKEKKLSDEIDSAISSDTEGIDQSENVSLDILDKEGKQ